MKTLVWQPPRDNTWSVRLHWDGCTNASGCQTWGGFATRAEANAAATLLQSAIERGDGQFLDAMRRRSHHTIGTVLASYLAAGLPGTKHRQRTPASAALARAHIAGPLQWWADHNPERIGERDCDAYAAHRATQVRSGTGHRTTELELGTLHAALNWAWRNGDLKEMPRSFRLTFRDAKAVQHARASMPASADELHQLATWQFTHDDPVFGWMTLFKAFSGLRDREALALEFRPTRTGAGYPPGFIDRENHCLRIWRAKGGCNPRLALDDPQRDQILPLIENIRAWRATISAPSDFLFPAGPADHTKSLQRAAAAMDLPSRRGHSLRAYYATVRLAQGQTPETVAHELGQRSGADLIRDVYGANPDDFDVTQFTSLATRYTWLPGPGTVPAWNWWIRRFSSNIIAL